MTTEQTGTTIGPKGDRPLDTGFVVELSAATPRDLPHLGGKGARLAELLQAGFPVPGGYCITSAAFRKFLEKSGLEAEIQKLESGSQQSWTRIRELVAAAEIPADLSHAIIRAYEAMGRPRVAVRSSAIGEDSALRSFAGQHDTVLDIAGDEALLAAVKRCWASLWSDRARVYRTMNGAMPRPDMGVVVQTMIHPESAGVLFTMDPVAGQDDRVILESCFGLGEGLVAGRVTTDSFVFDRESKKLLDKQIRYKVTMCAPVGAGETGMVKVDEEKRDAPTLSDDQARELVELALRVRAHYGTEQDIEWAVRGHGTYLLQARPITTTKKPAQRWTPYIKDVEPKIRDQTLWSRMDIGEIFTGIMTPFGISFAKYYQDNVHADCIRALGIRDLGDIDLHMGYLQHFVYLNVSLSAWSLAQTPPGRDQSRFTTRFASEEVDLAQYENPFGQFPGGLSFGRSVVQWLRYVAGEVTTMKRRAQEMVASRFAEYDRMRELDLASLGTGQLNVEMERALKYFHDMHVGYMPFYINAFGFYNILTELCSAWLGKDGVNLQNRLKADMSNLRTVEAAREVWKLAQRAKEIPAVKNIVKTVPLEEIPDALMADPDGARFWKHSIEEFMRINGTRAREEMELTHPRWVDDPSYVFQMVRKYVEEEISIDEVLESRQRERSVDSEKLLARLPKQRQYVLGLLMRLYSLNSRLREDVRPAMTTACWLVRTLVYEVGRRLVEEGVLRSIDEVAYLHFDEVLGFLRDDKTARRAFNRDRMDERRREHQYHLRLPEPPLTLIGTYDPREAVRYKVGDGTSITGLGTSPGRVRARARLIHDLVRQADEFEPGEILVTPFTDSSWTPLFAIAGGVVTDIGSMLSHSSIVSREFAIPSVVNTKIATKVIRTGDVLTVDGEVGLVQIEREGS